MSARRNLAGYRWVHAQAPRPESAGRLLCDPRWIVVAETDQPVDCERCLRVLAALERREAQPALDTAPAPGSE